MPTLLPDLTVTFDHLPVGSTDPPAGAGWQRKTPDTTRVVDSRTRPGKRACRLVHNAGVDPINSSGERLEWSTGASGERAGSEGWYASAFILDPAWTPPSSWGVVLQWHHDSKTGSPPIAVRADRVWDPDKATAGALYLAGRDGGSAAERAWPLTPDVAVGVPVRVIIHVVWGGEPGSKVPGVVQCWTCIGDQLDATRETSWTPEHPAGGWFDTTFYGGPNGYWKGGWYCGSAQPAVLEHDGLIRRQSMAGCLEWFTPPAAPIATIPDVREQVQAARAIAMSLTEGLSAVDISLRSLDKVA